MKVYFGTPGWGWLMWGIGYRAKWFIGFSMARSAFQPSDEDTAHRLVSCAPDGSTCTLNINGTERYYDQIIPNNESNSLAATNINEDDKL